MFTPNRFDIFKRRIKCEPFYLEQYNKYVNDKNKSKNNNSDNSTNDSCSSPFSSVVLSPSLSRRLALITLKQKLANQAQTLTQTQTQAQVQGEEKEQNNKEEERPSCPIHASGLQAFVLCFSLFGLSLPPSTFPPSLFSSSLLHSSRHVGLALLYKIVAIASCAIGVMLDQQRGVWFGLFVGVLLSLVLVSFFRLGPSPVALIKFVNETGNAPFELTKTKTKIKTNTKYDYDDYDGDVNDGCRTFLTPVPICSPARSSDALTDDITREFITKLIIRINNNNNNNNNDDDDNGENENNNSEPVIVYGMSSLATQTYALLIGYINDTSSSSPSSSSSSSSSSSCCSSLPLNVTRLSFLIYDVSFSRCFVLSYSAFADWLDVSGSPMTWFTMQAKLNAIVFDKKQASGEMIKRVRKQIMRKKM